jgi:hypothetical protein
MVALPGKERDILGHKFFEILVLIDSEEEITDVVDV